ncbi:shikimate kinase I [Opitutaceae bacterium TAV5]|nr:shikimate kinase I [Opitutaceae bacterium TAV5]
MKLVFLHGPAAAGKLTIGRALQDLTGFRLFHNHLVVDTLLSVFQFGSESFIRLREEMWLSVFSEAAKQGVSLIFTFAPETTVRPEFIGRTIDTIKAAGGEVHFVELTCPIDELERRIENPSRAQFMKLRSVETFRKIRQNKPGQFPPLPSSGLSIDTSTMQPNESARQICGHLNLPIVSGGAKIEHYPEAN